jgi:SAM-dependent methyltransferase
MSKESPKAVDLAEGWEHTEIDTSVAHPARMYDYYIGGKNNFPADREAAETFLAHVPHGAAGPLANRAFLGRAVRFLLDEGVRQFLDIGVGIPGPNSTSEVAHATAPGDARVVCVDNDPIVLAHSRALLAEQGAGHTTVVRGDLRQAADIVNDPAVRDALDFDEPVAVLLLLVLHFLHDTDDPAGAVRALMRDLPPGSYLVVTHLTGDFNPGGVAAATGAYDKTAAQLVPRGRKEIEGFFEGLEIVEPGVVQVPFWRPDGELPENAHRMWAYAVVGRKG